MARASALLGLLILAACSSATGQPIGRACIAAGGECRIGAPECAGVADQVDYSTDCNPDENPGGGFCCLPCPSGMSPPADGGYGCE